MCTEGLHRNRPIGTRLQGVEYTSRDFTGIPQLTPVVQFWSRCDSGPFLFFSTLGCKRWWGWGSKLGHPLSMIMRKEQAVVGQELHFHSAELFLSSVPKTGLSTRPEKSLKCKLKVKICIEKKSFTLASFFKTKANKQTNKNIYR